MFARLFRSVVASGLLLLALTVLPVAAGGGAEIVPDEAAPPEPRAGEPFEYGFTVMQHGRTPAGWEEPTLTVTNVVTGEQASFPAARTGKEGHFSATATLGEGGLYTWTVSLRDLVVTSPPVTGTVLARDGSRPQIDVAHAFTAIESARRTLAMELREEFNARMDVLDESRAALRDRTSWLRTQVTELTAERDELVGRVAALERASESPATPGVPLLGVVSLAVLAGAVAGFLVAWLGTRRDPVALDPAAVGGRVTA